MVSEPPQVDVGELNELRSLFKAPEKPSRKRHSEIPPLVLNPYRVLNAMDVRRMYYYRHGTEEPTDHVEMTYSEVAKKMHMPISTVFNALKCFKRDGYRFLNRRKLNFQSAWERQVKLKGAIKDFLLNHQVLSEWASYNLNQRVKELKKLGVTVYPKTLSLFYRRNKVNYRVVKYQFSRARDTPLSDIQRFVVDLARRVKLDQNIVYFDETSCNMWMRKRMSWCSRAHPVRMHLNKNAAQALQ